MHLLDLPAAFALLTVPLFFSTVAAAVPNIVQLEIKTELKSRLANIHVLSSSNFTDIYTVTYGECHVSNSRHSAHHVVGMGSGLVHESRLVWIMPEDIFSGGCLSAWVETSEAKDTKDKGTLLGRSVPLLIRKEPRHWKRAKRAVTTEENKHDREIEMNKKNGIDVQGPWFDGVELLKDKEIKAVDVKAAKAKKIAIIGAGMAGLMTFLCLNQSGLHNLEIIEAADRLGGRVHTQYLQGGPFDYQYQEMGPMRFPESTKYLGSNKTIPINDMKLVFQLAQEMNKINGHSKNLSVDFIPWIQNSPNGLYYFNGIKKPDGMPPTVTEAILDPRYRIRRPPTPQAVDEGLQVIYNFTTVKIMEEAAKNIFTAYKAFQDGALLGFHGDDWSEFAWFHNHLKLSLNATDQVQVLDNGGSGYAGDSFWEEIYGSEYFMATTWKTIDGGLDRLPLSFHPSVDGVTQMNRKVQRASYLPKSNKVRLGWKHGDADGGMEEAEYDYAMIAVPFTIVRQWRFPNTLFNPTKQSAIQNLAYTPACKVALQFRTRFWEHYKKPIYGSCSTETDIPGIGNICYPSYKLHMPGPGVMLASYISGDFGNRLVALSEKEHVQYVLDAMIEIHGEIAREQYTGRYARKCWLEDPLETTSWASPSVGQHELYMPQYFKTENNMIFVGEHTSYTQAWISSALESAVRGSVQLLLELGLVDEAKNVTEKWMSRWISV